MVVNVLLFNDTLKKSLSSIEYNLAVPTLFNCTLQLLFAMFNLLRDYTQMKLTCVKCIFRFTFKSRGKRGNEKQKIIFNAKDNLVRNHSFMKSAKNSEIRTPTLHPPSPYLQISNFGLSSLALFDFPNWYSIAPDNFGNFHKNLNNEIKIVA